MALNAFLFIFGLVLGGSLELLLRACFAVGNAADEADEQRGAVMIPADAPSSGELVAEIERLKAHLASSRYVNSVAASQWEDLGRDHAALRALLRSYINLFDTMANGLEVSAIELFVAREAMRDAISKSEVRP